MLLLSSADFFQNKLFRKIISRILSVSNLSVSNGLDPDQDCHFVCPDLYPNHLQRLSADDKGCC